MRLYLGKQQVQTKMEKHSDGQPLYQNQEVLLYGEKHALRMALENRSHVFLWGAIYAVRKSNGEYDALDLDGNGPILLKQLIQSQGVAAVSEQIEGDFVLVVIDDNGRVDIVCDRFNRTEIFYQKIGNGALVATDLDAVMGCVNPSYDQVALANLLGAYGHFAPKRHTIYKQIRRLGVGERLNWENGILNCEVLPYDPKSIRPFGTRENNEYADLMADAVRIRGTESCNWVYLSSGWDSTSLLALLVARYGASKVRCVTGEMRYSERAGVINQFEIDRARQVAEYFGVSLDIVPFDLCKSEALETWQSITPVLKSQHVYAFSAFNYFCLHNHIAQKGDPGDSVFAGEISDGVHNFGFSQYATILEHPDLNFREYSDKMASYLFGPSFFQSVLNNTFKDDQIYRWFRERVGGDACFDATENFDADTLREEFLASFFLRGTRLPFYSRKNSQILTQHGQDATNKALRETYLASAAKEIQPETLYGWLIYLYNSFFWQGSTVRILGLPYSIAGDRLRMPFWDGRLHQFLSEMPEEWGRGLELRPTKYPLKWMLQNRVNYPLHLQTGPHSYLYDVNPQFSHASEFLYASYLSDHFKAMLSDYPYEKILDADWFNLDYLRGIVDQYCKGVELIGQERSDLLSLVLFCQVGWY